MTEAGRRFCVAAAAADCFCPPYGTGIDLIPSYGANASPPLRATPHSSHGRFDDFVFRTNRIMLEAGLGHAGGGCTMHRFLDLSDRSTALFSVAITVLALTGAAHAAST